MSELISPTTGLAVLHLFCKTKQENDEQPDRGTDRQAVIQAVKKIKEQGDQVVTAAIFMHKADISIILKRKN